MIQSSTEVSTLNVNELTRDDWLRATFPEWGNWLVEEIDATVVEPGNVAMWWLGCMGVWLKTERSTNLTIDFWVGTGKRSHPTTPMADRHQYHKMSGSRITQPNLRLTAVVIDPFAVKHLDAFLSTHFHSDHIDPYATAAVLRNCSSAKFIGPKACADVWKSWGVPSDRIVEVRPGDAITIGDVKITALESFDRTTEITEYPIAGVDGAMDDKAVNYVLETGGGVIYHAGDSHYANQFVEHGKKFDIDVAIGAYAHNPIGITDKMTASDFIRMGEALNADVIIPMHYDTWSNFQSDVREIEMLYDLQAERLGYKFHPFIWQLGGRYIYPLERSKRRFNYERGFPDAFDQPSKLPFTNFL